MTEAERVPGAIAATPGAADRARVAVVLDRRRAAVVEVARVVAGAEIGPRVPTAPVIAVGPAELDRRRATARRASS